MGFDFNEGQEVTSPILQEDDATRIARIEEERLKERELEK